METATKEVGLDNILGTLKKNAPAKSSSGKTYPIVPDQGGMVTQLADSILEYSEYADALKGAKGQMTELAVPCYYGVNSGKADASSGVVAKASNGREVFISFSSFYSGINNPELLDKIAPNLSQEMERKYSITIKGDKLPKHRENELLSEMVALFGKYGATDALEVKDSYVPVEGFHIGRHIKLTPEQNALLHEQMRCRISVRTKGRK